MYESIPEFYRASLESEHGAPRRNDAPSRDDSPPPPPDSTVARPESVPAFVVIWEWKR